MKKPNKIFRYQELPFIESVVDRPMIGKTWGNVIQNAGLPHAQYTIYSDDNILYFPECERVMEIRI